MRASFLLVLFLVACTDARRTSVPDGAMSSGDGGTSARRDSGPPSDGGTQPGVDSGGGECGACADPPASVCFDADTLRIYDSVGSCVDGRCAYGFRDQACTNCPNCDPCAGVTCATPPNGCF